MKKAYPRVTRRYRAAAIISALLLMVFAAAGLVARRYICCAAQFLAGVALLVYVMLLRRKRKEEFIKYIGKLDSSEDGISENMLLSIPAPVAVCDVDGSIRWHNAQFSNIFGGKELVNEMLDDYMHEIKWSDVLKYPKGRDAKTVQGDSVYSVQWRMVKDSAERDRKGDRYSVFFYLRDVTNESQLKEAYHNERIDVAVINIDNYDDFLQKADDDVVEAAASRIRAAVAAWAKSGNAVLKKTDRDRYFAVFEHRYLKGYVDKNFDILKNVAAIAEEVKFPVSISIGIGSGGSIIENESSARNALDLALGRGGGQVCVKDDTQFKFYGGKNGEYERSTRVKARAVSAALSDFIKSSDNVILMGHKSADFDSFGAAVGLQRAVRHFGKTPYIVHERVSPAIDNMFEELRGDSEYNGMFVDENEVLEEVTPNTLLIVLDTHRPSMLPCPKLIERVDRVVLIDHHRRSTEFISPLSLVYHEPYASSTCEMVTELLEYMNLGSKITKLEAQCLYTGIMLDTKNFMLKTGVRTFEAASYLRRFGLDTVAVRRMFCTSSEDYAKKAEIVRSAVMAGGGIAIAKTYTSDKNMRQIASQAADDMLNIKNVVASVVVYPADGGTGFSARSIGTLNVQLIMEKLGGGGHMTVSGAFIRDIGVDEGTKRAEQAVKSYLEDIK